MKKIMIIAAILIVVVAGAVAGYKALTKEVSPQVVQQQDYETSDYEQVPATDFTMENEDGDQVNLKDFYGKPIVLNFWATWCPPCREELPDFDEAYAKYGDEIQFLIVDLTDGEMDTLESAKAFADDNGYTFPCYFDTAGGGVSAYGVTSIPTTYFIDSKGYIYAYQVGQLTGDRLESFIGDMLAAEE